ncbi:hypothetical protein B9Z55_003159 [Caenorhabditis nigoni]|uniref:DUF19 domain-containing protein n=1 Tax=Caenorhabditis nigoni TaxID=1611254 RepID=A0A2G5VP90_9PELO|nr:hypothetical protein B9Z55_003159 [Caenorhabditis nigoni]
MKFQFLILLALVGFGASQNKEDLAMANQCFFDRFDQIEYIKYYNREAVNQAKDLLWNPAGCGKPDKCYKGYVETMKKNSTIRDAPEFARYLENEFNECFSHFKPTELLNLINCFM